MLVSYNWLQDFIKEPLSAPEDIAEGLNAHSFEIDGVEKAGAKYPGVVVGYVESVEKHPNADRLSVCVVDTGDSEKRQIICGAKNIKKGQFVPVALPGANLPNGVKIEKATIRSVESFGMVCSKEELCEESDGEDGISVLEGDLEVGALYDEIKGTGVDYVLDVDVLANRASDCLSHRGIAREIAVIFGLTFLDYKEGVEASEDSKYLSINIKDDGSAKRYIGAYLKGLSVKESPDWLKSRLSALGLRPINNIVDATNYIMFSIGQPVHAFDAEKLEKKDEKMEIGVRFSKKGEKVLALDDAEYEMPESAALITDEAGGSKPIAIAGIMGGKESAISESTKEVVLETAVFDPVITRKTTQKIKLKSNSSKRFENDVTPVFTPKAMRALIDLLESIASTAREEVSIEAIVDNYSKKQEEREVKLSPKNTSLLLGVEISDSEVKEILDKLMFEYKKDGDGFLVTPPSERLDISIEEDLIEEVGRIYGYQNIGKVEVEEKSGGISENKKFFWLQKVRDVLVEEEWSEIITYTLRKEGELPIKNPMVLGRDYFRSSIFPGLREALQKNLMHANFFGVQSIKVFEIGSVYRGDEERFVLGLAEGSTSGKEGLLEKSLSSVSSKLDFDITSILKIEGDVAEVDFEELLNSLPEPKEFEIKDLSAFVDYKPISPFPYVLRDVAVWVPLDVSLESVLRIIKENAGSDLVKVYLFDEYTKDESISYAFRLVFQSFEKTLRDEEVNEVTDKIYSKLNEKEGWETR